VCSSCAKPGSPMNVKCWASCLGDCSSVQSREHLVSQAIFAHDTVTVRGLSWCPTEYVTIGLKGLASKILCQKHNSQLSDLDQAAGEWYSVFRGTVDLARKRKQEPPWVTPEVVTSRVNAAGVERWLLKTLINVTYGSALHIADRRCEPGSPPLWLVEMCFGRRAFEGHSGLYVAGIGGHRLKLSDDWACSPITGDRTLLLGAAFELHGIKLVLSLIPHQPLPPPSEYIGMMEDWKGLQLHQRFARITLKAGIWQSQVIEFDWSSAV
jgi:hypothetical protein